MLKTVPSNLVIVGLYGSSSMLFDEVTDISSLSFRLTSLLLSLSTTSSSL